MQLWHAFSLASRQIKYKKKTCSLGQCNVKLETVYFALSFTQYDFHALWKYYLTTLQKIWLNVDDPIQCLSLAHSHRHTIVMCNLSKRWLTKLQCRLKTVCWACSDVTDRKHNTEWHYICLEKAVKVSFSSNIKILYILGPVIVGQIAPRLPWQSYC